MGRVACRNGSPDAEGKIIVLHVFALSKGGDCKTAANRHAREPSHHFPFRVKCPAEWAAGEYRGQLVFGPASTALPLYRWRLQAAGSGKPARLTAIYGIKPFRTA